MTTNPISILNSTAPPPPRQPWKFKTARTAQAEINRLESLLGMPASPLNFNLNQANARVRELEQNLGAFRPTAVPAAAASKAVSAAITFADWRAKSDADQKSFCRDGGKMQREEFLNMPCRSQSAFLSAGGKIEAPGETPKSARAALPAGGMWKEDFEALSPQEQTAFFAAGKKVFSFKE